MRLLNIKSTLPVVDHHTVPDLGDLIGSLRIPLDLRQIFLRLSQRVLGRLAHKDRFRSSPAVVIINLLLLDEVCDFANINSRLTHNFLVLAREGQLQHFHHSASLLHFDVESLYVPEENVEIFAYLSG